MITNFRKQTRKDDIKFLLSVILIFVLVAWLCTPPGNKFLQVCFWGNNAQYLYAKYVKKDNANAYIFHRNNAVYLAKMDLKLKAYDEINKAIELYPSYYGDNKLNNLYKDKGIIYLFFGDYKEALGALVKTCPVTILDHLRIAMLFKTNGNYKLALNHCNEIFAIDFNAYAGYACAADVYAQVGKVDTSIRLYDLLISKSPNRAKYYADRAEYKRMLYDVVGYEEDMAKAKELSSYSNLEFSITKDILAPKKLDLSIL